MAKPFLLRCRPIIVLAIFIALTAATHSIAVDDVATQPVLNVPEGFSIELAAGPPLVERPITGAFDEEGRLYVAESSGSNDPVQEQLEKRPHRIVRLEDTDDDGKFDRRTVFADRMMFPEGTMFLNGSLYVSAPPSIWKLTDTDNDGIADERVEWFQGKTLTGCANDLHGPYLGPDGWIYWCKGAFAEQTHVVNGREWKTRAAHIFRCRPNGSGLEPVLTGGMDNPVDVVHTPEGERILSATLVVGQGRRDGILHAVYGGVYGKEHGVLAGHPRTGPLMPVMSLMSPTSPCGLERYESDVFGREYLDNLFSAQFNVRKVARHVLRPDGSTFASEDTNFVWSDNVDFHPTDVLMDADGSLLVLDTGGWYKLCCPTSQLWKPDVLGGIYRVRRVDAKRATDPRGKSIAWASLDCEMLWKLMADSRPAVRQRASREVARRRDSDALREFLAKIKRQDIRTALLDAPPSSLSTDTCGAKTAQLARVWTLAQLEVEQSHELVCELVGHYDESVRHAALCAVSLHRDAAALSKLYERLAKDAPANRRVAAEALGRIGDRSAVPHLLVAAADAGDRVLQHSITYALIELAEPTATRAGLASDSPDTVAAALVALDQMPDGGIKPDEVVPQLNSSDDHLRETAQWIVSQHPEWGGELVEWMRQQLGALPDRPDSDTDKVAEEQLQSMLLASAAQPAVRALITEALSESSGTSAARRVALQVISNARLKAAPPKWRAALARLLPQDDQDVLPLAIAAARALPPTEDTDALHQALVAIADNSQVPTDSRVAALSGAVAGLQELSDPQLELLVTALSDDNSAALRTAAADALSRSHLTLQQLERLCVAIESVSPLELTQLLGAFAQSSDVQVGKKLIESLKRSQSLSSLRIDVLRAALADYGPAVLQGIDELETLVNVDASTQRKRIEELLPLMAGGDVRRGHAVFYSTKASCSACHRLGNAGGTIGPELTRIGDSRTERDLLESILYPSLSFVRSFEPMLITTVDGRMINGIIRDETARECAIAIGADQEVRVQREDIEEIVPSTVSTMPAGLDQQLSPQELADLVAFLKNAQGKK